MATTETPWKVDVLGGSLVNSNGNAEVSTMRKHQDEAASLRNALPSPPPLPRHRLQILQEQLVLPGLHPWQEQQPFLNLRGQPGQVHDVRQPRRSDVPQPGQLGIRLDLPRSDQLIEVDRQRH
jgi:hypothetical protein